MSFGLAKFREPVESPDCLRKQPNALSAAFAASVFQGQRGLPGNELLPIFILLDCEE